jgi:thiosulfate/3-mercaptopyruvate sulfurtransferase
MTMYQTIISAEELSAKLKEQDWVVIDCRYDLADMSSGYRSYLDEHIVGAIYADIHNDLSGEPLTDHGRHPLPGADKLRKVFSSFGISQDKQVVVYDASSGAFAARLWWLLRYMGHEAVAVLDGGWQAWQTAKLETATGEAIGSVEIFTGEPIRDWLVIMDEVAEMPLLVDSRDAERYRGDIEPIDPLAGHIPGAINHCWKENLGENGYFLDSEQLKQQFSQIYADTPAEQVVFYCGSGVSACHNLLAVAHAGLAPAKLYAGSWSEWCRQDDCPLAIGAAPS